MSKLVADNLTLFSPLFFLLYGFTCYAAYRYSGKSAKLPVFIVALSAVIFTFGTFCLLGFLTENLFLPAFIPTSTMAERIALLLLNAPLVSILAGAVLAYPVKVTLGKALLVPLIGAALISLSIQFPSILPAAGSRATTRLIIGVDLVCFFIVVPLTVHYASKLLSFAKKPTPRPGG